MKKRILSVFVTLALCLGLLPVTALAAAPIGQVLYVGGVQISSTGYWTTDSNGNVTAYTDDGTTPSDNYIHYDKEANTLTLYNATIKKGLDYDEDIEGGTYIIGSAIGVFNQHGNAELTIQLEGSNTIDEVSTGIYVLAPSQNTGSSSLTITGDGSLNASASQTGICVQSNSNNAALCVENAEVTASADGAVKNGVLVQAKDGSDVSLTVNGGSLTASVNANIWFQFGSGISGSGTPTVTVSNNAIVRANGGIANNSSTSIQYGTGNEENGGIVFDGSIGTVYGSVTLQDDLTIGAGETLTIGDGASLNTGSHEVIVNGGTLTGGDKIEGTVKYAPAITTESLPGGTVGEPYTETILAATGDASITWSVSNGSLPAGLSLSKDGKITGTPTTEGTSTFTVTATNNIGSDSREFTLKIEKPAFIPVTDLELNKDSLTLQEKGSDTLIATVKPADATNQDVTWESSDTSIATVSADGTVTAISAGNATITATAADGSGVSASCELTVTHGNMVHTPKKDATCTEYGNEEYWICENCGKYFGDANGDTEIEEDSWIISAINHDWNDAVYTWSDDGSTCTATRTCKNDSAHTETSKATVTGAQTKAPTCTEKGETTYTATFEADWAMTQTKVLADISATGHGETERINAKDATCTQEGYTGDQVCKDCGDVLEQGHVTAKIAHNYKDGKCTVCGSADPNYNPNPQSPQTGDRHNVELWSSLLLVAAASFVLLTAVRRREREDA
ncbi:MAG TPA: Ig domain-containing protein [Candidatus Enterenecus avicola]|nr:Ig domain-containing protein [Candidatus Enterenecus avicola]